MESYRIDGIKYNLEKEPLVVLESMRGYLLAQHARLIEDIEVVTAEINKRIDQDQQVLEI